MDKEESVQILDDAVQALRSMSYSELRRFFRPAVSQVTGKSKRNYQIETQATYDDPRTRRDLRIIVSIMPMEGGRLRTLFPRTDGFIKAPDDKLVGE